MPGQHKKTIIDEILTHVKVCYLFRGKCCGHIVHGYHGKGTLVISRLTVLWGRTQKVTLVNMLSVCCAKHCDANHLISQVWMKGQRSKPCREHNGVRVCVSGVCACWRFSSPPVLLLPQGSEQRRLFKTIPESQRAGGNKERVLTEVKQTSSPASTSPAYEFQNVPH